jgi:hypothetical protein
MVCVGIEYRICKGAAMRRTVLLAVGLGLLLVPLLASGQESVELDGIHLVAWEDIPGASPRFAAPVSAAILMAWHAAHGYPQLLPDLNGDGRVDEADTIELARQFAEPMGALQGPVWDPRVVDVVAHYVADRYPDTFQLWIYDPSIEEEFREHMGRSFDPADDPGIEIRLLEEPSREAYVSHLEQQRPGIVGIGSEPEVNDFAVSRSAVLHEEPDGWPVDLVNSNHEAFGPDPVWQTLLRIEPDRWAFDHRGWTPFEVFIVLVPIREAEEGTIPSNGSQDEPGGEPGDNPNNPGDTPGDEPGTKPGGEPGTTPGGTPSNSGTPDNFPTYTPDPSDDGACCLPTGSCDTTNRELCERLGGTFFYGLTCETLICPSPSEGPCSAVQGDILDMCYKYEADGSLTIQVTYELVNNGPVAAHNIQALYIGSIGHNNNAFTGNVWEYGITIGPNGGTYTHTEYFNGPGNIPGPLRLYGGLWIQKLPPWDCWGIVKQGAVKIDEPAVLCDGGTPGGGDEDLVGACCLPDGSCDRLTAAQCDQRSGAFRGPGSSCAQDCPSSEPEPEPTPTALPNLWVTDMNGCWSWSTDGREHVIATVTGIVHNGGQADASNVRARVTAGGTSTIVTVGSISAGGQKTVSATLDVGSYDTVSWPVQTSITADPTSVIAEADETNNTTNSAFPQSSDCN